MSIQSSGFLARCATRNHTSGLENGEIFIAESSGDSKFTGKSLKGEVLDGVFEETDFNRLRLPSGRFAVSTGEYETIQHGHLSFMKFTLLSIDEEFDERWFKGSVTLDSGKRLGNPGMFPACVVAELPTVEQVETMVGLVIESLEPKLEGEIPLSKGECVRITNAKSDWYTVQKSNGITGLCPKTFLKIVENSQYQEEEMAIEPYCTALYDFNAEHETELSFATGDVIKLFRWVDHEWLEGENQRTGLSGYIPASFVQVIVPPGGIEFQLTGDSMDSTNKGDDCSTIGIGTVLYGFEARYPDELSVEAGASIKVLEIQGDWVKCWNPDTDETGIIPRSYLRIFSEYDDTSYTGSRATNSVISTASENEEPLSTTVERQWEMFEDSSKPITRSTSASMFLSSGTEVTEEKKTPPARPPPPNFSLPMPSTPADNGLQLQLRKNLQPVQRMAPSRPRSMTKIYTVPATQAVGDRISEGWESRRIKVLDEIIQSETAYLFDISSWETAIENNPRLSENKKKMILNGYSMLKYLSRGLTYSLIAEQTKPIIDQEVGLTFMKLKDVFYKTYGQYFRTAEKISDIIMKGDYQIQKALQECLEEMRQSGSNVFDVPTALSRPIQRCLKYPLYLSEIVKNTPLTHPDHPKLMEALKQMGQLATKMNESKRRKELTKKYSRSAVEQRDSGFFNRLSKFNIHSIVKKSNRLQYRITTRIGFAPTYHDEEFDRLLKTLEEVQQRFCHLIYQMTVYKNRIVRLAKRYVEINTIIKIPPGQEPSIRFEHNNLLRRLLVYSDELNSEVVELCCTAQELAKRDFTFIVHKRYDKLADWEMAIRAKKLADIIDMRKCEFEALNSQLKIIFPKEIDKLIDGLKKYVKRIKEVDNAFFKRVRNWLDEFKTTDPPDFRKYVDPKNLRLRQIENTLRTRNAKITARLYQAREPEQYPSVTCSSNHPPLVYDQPIFGRGQTRGEREKLIKLCQVLGFHDALCKVTQSYVSEDRNFVLNKGDVIRERSVKNEQSLVDNGLAIFNVPTSIYRKVEDPFSTTLVDTSDSGDASDNDTDLNLESIQEFLASQERGKLSNESFKQSQRNDQKLFGIPDEVVKKVQSQRRRTNNQNETESINWLQYDDKIINLPGLEDYSRPAPAPPEAMLTWTTFDNENDTPRVIVPPQNVFGSLHNPIPMEPVRLSTTGDSHTYNQVFEGDLTWRALPPEPRPHSVQLSPTNSSKQQQNRHSSINSSPVPTRSHQPSRKSEPDLLARLVNEEIARTKDMSISQRSISPNFPRAPTTAPPEPPMNKKPPLPTRDYKDNSTKEKNNSNAISKFDFVPTDDDGVQLKMTEGESVKILRRHDDAENPEWWLVSNAEGKTGYVPGTYLSLNS